MKDGWVLAPDYLWVMNTSGIITLQNETYIIAIFTQEYMTLDEGSQIAQQVCQVAGGALTSS